MHVPDVDNNRGSAVYHAFLMSGLTPSKLPGMLQCSPATCAVQILIACSVRLCRAGRHDSHQRGGLQAAGPRGAERAVPPGQRRRALPERQVVAGHNSVPGLWAEHLCVSITFAGWVTVRARLQLCIEPRVAPPCFLATPTFRPCMSCARLVSSCTMRYPTRQSSLQ